MEFSKDEVKDKVIWTKGADFTDGSPRYTFEGRDPTTTYERFQVVIYTERERRYAHDPGSLCNHYYGYVRDDKMECAETIGPYYSVREAKQKTLELFNLFMQQYANQEFSHRISRREIVPQRPSGGKRDYIDPYGEKEWLNLSISRRRKRRGRRIPTWCLCCVPRASAPFAPVESIVSSYIFGNFKNFRSNGRCFGDRREKMGRRKGRRRPSRKTRKPLRPRRFGG